MIARMFFIAPCASSQTATGSDNDGIEPSEYAGSAGAEDFADRDANMLESGWANLAVELSLEEGAAGARESMGIWGG